MNKVDIFKNVGVPVSAERLQNCKKHLEEIYPTVTKEMSYSIVNKIKYAVEYDRLFDVIGAIHSLDNDLAKIDLTGRYRLLASILTEN